MSETSEMSGMPEIHHRAAVLGKPIAHSLSPILHNAAYRELGLSDWFYDRAEVAEEDLERFISNIDGTWRGLSLTMPLKKTVVPLGTPQDKWSQYLKVANTVVFRGDGRTLDLYNTDVSGIEAALNDRQGTASGQANFAPVTRQCVILGSGSTAASALAAVAELGAKRVVFAARHPQRALLLLSMAADLGVTAEAVSLEGLEAGDLKKAQYVISTIPAHGADAFAKKIRESHLDASSLTLLDVVYDPRPSALMKAVKERGGVALGGQTMLLWQAVAQVAVMTGTALDAVPVAAMRAALQEALG